MDIAVGSLSKEATKLCIAFSTLPTPSIMDCKSLVNGTENALLSLLTIMYQLPEEEGVTLVSIVRQRIATMTSALHTLVKVIRTHGSTECQLQRQSAGSLWECCDKFVHVPRENHQAVVCRLKETQELVNDALNELQQALEPSSTSIMVDDREDDDEMWTEDDRVIASPALGLIMASCSATKKIMKMVATTGDTKTMDLDGLVPRVGALSPTVDEVVLAVYPPIDVKVLAQQCEKLASSLLNVLHFIKYNHFCQEQDETWLEFLCKAVQHNTDKMTSLVT